MTISSAADFWQGPTTNVPVVNADGNVFEETQVATGGQTVFTLLTFTYTTGTHSIFVYRKTAADGGVGGEILRRAVDYTETASNKITLAVGAVAGDVITFVAFAMNQIIAPIVNNGVPQGGTAGQVLTKVDSSDYNTLWNNPASITTLLDAPRQSVASASTVNLLALAATTRNIQITGSVQIDGFQVTNGQLWVVRFAAALLVKNNASIVTQASKDVRMYAGSTCLLRATADNVVELLAVTHGTSPNSQSVTPEQFGAVGNGVADDAVPLASAISAAITAKVPLFLSANYLTTVELAVTGALTIQGTGNTLATISLSSTTQNGLKIATLSKQDYSRFQIAGQAAATAGALISLDSGTGAAPNQFAAFYGIWFQGGWDQLKTVAASGWDCSSCLFFGPRNTCVVIADTAITDAGDMQIIGCTMSGLAGVGTAITQNSAGGLRLIGNKIIQFANAYTLSLSAGVATSDLFIADNSMEAFTGNGLTLSLGAGVVFGAVQIVGNEISGAFVCLNMSPNSGPWCNHVEITGNNFGFSAAGTGVNLSGVNNCTFTGNTIVGSGSGTGLVVNTFVTNTIIANNTISGTALPINDLNITTTVRIYDNLGYNPVGASAAAPTASPWTFQNGHSPCDLYVSATTGISAITINGASILPVAVPGAAVLPVILGCNDVAVITYTGVATAKKMVH